MNTDDFYFELPSNQIAQTPIIKRDESKLMVVHKKNKELEHKTFKDIINYLNKDDVLVLNNTRVIPARLFGQKEKTNAKIEVLMLKETNNDWDCLVKPSKRIKVGDKINFNNKITFTCIKEKEEGIKTFKLDYKGVLIKILEEIGTMPIPPYIKETLEDQKRYQTTYAQNNGSVAAPTAGLHFTKDLLEKIKEKGVNIVYITLHVGLGTFKPITATNILDHKMHSEQYEIDEKTVAILNKAKLNNSKIIAVGTTTVRTLETNYSKHNIFKEEKDNTDIFIYPGYKFKAVDILITNFHLPKSTLLMLISAFTTKEIILNAYEEAINNKYKFFSFGDSMVII